MAARRLFGFFGLCGLLAGSAALAQEAQPAKGPAYLPSPFRGFVVYDDRYPPGDANNRTGKIHCLVCENGLAPVVAIYSRLADEKDQRIAPGSSLSDLLKQLNMVLYQRRGNRPAAFVQFLTLKRTPQPDVDPATLPEVTYADDDRTKVEGTPESPKQVFEREVIRDAVGNFGKSLKIEMAKDLSAITPPIPDDRKRMYVPLSLAAAEGKTLAAYGLKPGDEITVILYDRLREVKRFTFTKDKPLTTEDAKAIAAAADAMIAGEPVK